jgi:hypothetical protein
MEKSITFTPISLRKLLSWKKTLSEPPFMKKNLFANRIFTLLAAGGTIYFFSAQRRNLRQSFSTPGRAG